MSLNFLSTFMDIIKSFLPEIYFSFAIFLQLIFNSWFVNNIKFNFPIVYKEVIFQIFFIFIVLLFLYCNSRIEGVFFNFFFVADSASHFVKIIILVLNIFVFFFISRSVVLERINFYEYFTLFLLSLFGLLLLVNATDLLSVYLLIELQALCFYVLTSFKRSSSFSTEAGLKYFIAGSFISGVFLMGAALIYFTLGTLNFNCIGSLLFFSLSDSNPVFFEIICETGILLITFSLLFKLTAAPFQFWAPDVYEGAPLASTIIFSIIPKLSLFVLFTRWMLTISPFFFYSNFLLLFFALLSIFLGSLFAVRQKRFKRFILYSSLAQVGFLLIPFFLIDLGCIESLFFFLAIYLITSVLIWGNLISFYGSFKNCQQFLPTLTSAFHISSLAGLSKTNKLRGFAFMVIFFSVSGIPPFTGFLAKILIVFHLLESNEILIAVLLFILNMVSVYYYLRTIKIIYFEDKVFAFPNLVFQMSKTSFLSQPSEYILILFLTLLIYIFFDPSFFYVCSQYLALQMEIF